MYGNYSSSCWIYIVLEWWTDWTIQKGTIKKIKKHWKEGNWADRVWPERNIMNILCICICVRKLKSISGFFHCFFLTLRHVCPLRPMRSAVCFFSPDVYRGGQRLIKALFFSQIHLQPAVIAMGTAQAIVQRSPTLAWTDSNTLPVLVEAPTFSLMSLQYNYKISWDHLCSFSLWP